MNTLVIKRDGSKEEFSISNIAKVVATAGLTLDEARALSESVEAWVSASGKTEITSLEIRDKVLEELKKINSNAADLYTWYEQSKEV